MAHHHHRHCDEIGKSSKTRKKGMGVVRLGRRETKKKKRTRERNAIKVCRAWTFLGLLLFFSHFFFLFILLFSRSQQKGRSWRGLEVNKFRKKVFASSLSSIYIIYSSRVSIWRSKWNRVDKALFNRQCLTRKWIYFRNSCLLVCLSVCLRLPVRVSHPPLSRPFISSRFALYILLSLSHAGTFPLSYIQFLIINIIIIRVYIYLSIYLISRLYTIITLNQKIGRQRFRF